MASKHEEIAHHYLYSRQDLRVNEDLKQRVMDFALDNDVDVSWVWREAVAVYLMRRGCL